MANSRTTIAIVGAGLMGRVAAWRLLTAGYSVTLFDRDAIAGGTAAAYTAAGMLAPLSELESAESLVYHLGLRSLQLWPEWLHSLNAGALMGNGGTLVVAHAQDRSSFLQFQSNLAHKLASSDLLQMLEQPALAALEPDLAQHFSSALWLKNECWLNTHALLARLAQAIQSAKAVWHSQCEVESVAPGRVTVNGESSAFDWVVDCRGLGAKADCVNLRGVRGELLEVYAPEVNYTHMLRLMHPRYRLYLVPRPNHHYLLGATQIESEDYSPISVRSAMELLSALYTLHPGFAEARVVGSRSNCRPAFNNNLPAIHSQPGLLRVNGLYRHGYLMAPALAEAVQWRLDGETAASPFPELFHTDLPR
ncbi:glycine oxidase ThiO [Halioxenophilus sp. WMMB6]|uniref:glycine oxidase ThiO n=1 Tax=Halioxenophilus sp. WMMB6 TaxID=3073815 RepID=UPI00295EDB0D|nr:glycine oxidase ThiO [Halioxenophilus sp. WMMB6]